MSYDYYCHECKKAYEAKELKTAKYQDTHHIGGGTYPYFEYETIPECPECGRELDSEGYVCDSCGDVMREEYARYQEKPMCETCALETIEEDGYLMQCPKCKRLVDAALLNKGGGEDGCMMCTIDRMDRCIKYLMYEEGRRNGKHE